MKMVRLGTVTAVAIATALSLTNSARSDEMHKAAAFTADTLTWQEMSAGNMFATVSGDLTQGAWAGFVKLLAGSKSGVHTHSSDLKIVVVSGRWHYGSTPETEKNYGAGSYVFIPANLPHSNSQPEGALLYCEQPGKFDSRAVK